MWFISRGLIFCGVVCDWQLPFGFWWWGTKNAIDGSFHVSMHNFQISFGLSRSMEMSFLIFLFENGSFCNYCVEKVAECFWGHIVTLCRPRHLIQCKFAHFILPRSSHFVDTSHKLWGSWNISLPKSCQSKLSNLCIDHWLCATIIRPERQRYILQ